VKDLKSEFGPFLERQYQEYFLFGSLILDKLRPLSEELQISLDSSYNIVKILSAIRAIKLYSSINLLMQNDCYEDAFVLFRPFLEILTNLEEIQRGNLDDSDRYWRFGELHRYRFHKYLISYQIPEGNRKSFKREERQPLRDIESSNFFDFYSKAPYMQWKQSWSDRKIGQIIKESKNPCRIFHYKIASSLHFFFSSCNAVFSFLEPSPRLPLLIVGQKQGWDTIGLQEILFILTMPTSWLMEILFIANENNRFIDVAWIKETYCEIFRIFNFQATLAIWDDLR